MAGNNHYDLVILGSGSTAFAAALRAQELGKTSVMTEERIVGGTRENISSVKVAGDVCLIASGRFDDDIPSILKEQWNLLD